MEQDIQQLSPEERNDVESWVELGMDIMADYGIDSQRSVYENLDDVFEAWLNDQGEKPTQDAIILGLGAVFGDRLASKHETDWLLITDDYGMDFALTINGYQIYPMDFVAKRVNVDEGEEQELGFFSGLSAVIDEWQNDRGED